MNTNYIKRALLLLSFSLLSCSENAAPESASGVRKAAITIAATETFEGKKVTVEQYNILARQKIANTPGSVKHLYVISAYSGDVILYSTVKGKVTSSGKRLNPYTVVVGDAGQYQRDGFSVNFGGRTLTTNEILQDDGTYGSSNPYLFWIDVRGVSHEHYVSGGQIIHVSDTPMAFPKVILNLESESK